MLRQAMPERSLGAKLKDWLVTVGALWLILSLSGLPCLLFGAGTPAGIVATLTLYLALLSAYAFGTGPGRRSPFPAYFVGAMLYPAYFTLLLIAVEKIGRTDFLLEAVFALGAGIAIGFQVSGGADTPLEHYVLPWLLNFLVPIVLVLALRAIVQDRAARRSVG